MVFGKFVWPLILVFYKCLAVSTGKGTVISADNQVMPRINNAVGRLFPNQNHSENHHGFDKLVGTSKHCAKLVVATNPVYIYDMFANIRIEKSLYQLKCFVLLE